MIEIKTNLDWTNLNAAVGAAREAAGWESNKVQVFYKEEWGVAKLIFQVTPPGRDGDKAEVPAGEAE